MEKRKSTSMEVLVKSVEKVKPSWLSSSTGEVQGDDQLRQLPAPFKLCLLDQLTPSYYTPLILFYPAMTNKNPSRMISTPPPETVSKMLKQSLSHALVSFYPLSGRVKDNLVVHDFEAGVPFVEARVQGTLLSEFLRPPRLDFLNKLLPVEPCCGHVEATELLPPQVTVQMNTFDCGGVAIGLCFYHKTVDGATMSAFLKTWAAHCLLRHLVDEKNDDDDDDDEVVTVSVEDLSGGCTAFPPRESGIQPEFLSLMERLWFPSRMTTTTTTTRRFVFHDHAIDTLKSRATGTGIENPTRTEAILAFIWKSTLAAATTSKSPKLLCLSLAVNLRPRMKKKKKKNTDHHDEDHNVGSDLIFSQHSIGNLYSMAASFCNDDDYITASAGTSSLARLIREGVTNSLDEDYLNVLSSDQGLEAIAEGVGEFESTGALSLRGSSWVGLGFSEIDFGWGKPVWSGVVGEWSSISTSSGTTTKSNSTIFENSVILKELGPQEEEEDELSGNNNKNGIEAWMRLDHAHMTSLETDPEFLQFASPNPPILF